MNGPMSWTCPPGRGKTAALDIAVFHLALRADTPDEAAVRIALVVDRRLVVDGAFERARKIERALESPERRKHPVLKAVAQRLEQLAGAGEPPLVAARLRGGAPLEDIWARTPNQPAILCSTVDQVGSRLLFRGYGVSDRMKPIHAGLLGEGSLILLDEAHLSEPFRQTLGAVRSIGRAGVKTVLLTATPGAAPKRPFGLLRSDRILPELAKRLRASKRTRLRKVSKKDPATHFVKEAASMMKRLRQVSKDPPAVGVVVNRVALARAIHDALRKEDSAGDAVLMIGRCRGVDRDRTAERLAPFFSGADTRSAARPTFIVATQCLEVGVDLDLDGLVSQAASLDALRQRFGRLNRMGRWTRTEARILAVASDILKRADDPVYGDRIRKTWDALNEIATDGELDFGADALSQALASRFGPKVTELSAPRPDAPVLMPAYIGLWSQTAPVPTSDPEVGLFLHGAEKSQAEVSVVWRDDLVEDDLPRDAARREAAVRRLTERLTLVPPRSPEMIQLPLAAVRHWLVERDDRGGKSPEVADAPQSGGSDEPRLSGRWRPVFRWAGPDHARTRILTSRHELRPGDLIVVPSTYGGCDESGWNPSSTDAVVDVADEAARPYRARRHAVRLHGSRFGKAKTVWRRISTLLA